MIRSQLSTLLKQPMGLVLRLTSLNERSMMNRPGIAGESTL